MLKVSSIGSHDVHYQTLFQIRSSSVAVCCSFDVLLHNVVQIKDMVYASFTLSEAGLLFPYFAIESLTLPHANYFAEYFIRDREKCYTTPFSTVHSITLLWHLYNKSLTPILWKHLQLPYCIYLDIYFRLVHSLSCLCQELYCLILSLLMVFLISL